MAKDDSMCIALEGSPATLIWAPPVSGRSLLRYSVLMLVTFIIVGVSVPVSTCGFGPANVAKTRQDLDTIRQAITLHDAQNEPLRGTSFQTLLGRYLLEVPLDPWGNPYILLADHGIVMSLGADGQPGPGDSEEDVDLFVRYRPEPRSGVSP